MSLKVNLERLLKEHRLSLSQLAIETKIPKSNLAKWAAGANPNIMQLEKVASYFNITIDELVFNKKPSNEMEDLVNKMELHTGLYEISIKRVIKK